MEQQYQGYETAGLIKDVQSGHLTLSQLIEEREEQKVSPKPDQLWLTSLNEAITVLQQQSYGA